MKLLLRVILSIKTRSFNAILYIFSIFNLVSKGYENENFYKNIVSDELAKHEKNFNFWLNEEDREKKYNYTRDLINKIFPLEEKVKKNNNLNILKEDGCIAIQDLNIDKTTVSEIVYYLENKKIYLNHIVSFSKYSTTNFNFAKFFSKYGSFSLKDILNCKQLFNIISNKNLHKFVSDYFGCKATISNVNLFWTFPKVEDNFIDTRVSKYHRDLDDYKSVTFFLNLTDTTLEDGGHGYIKGSHKINFLKENFNLVNSKKSEKISNYNIKNIDGYNIPQEISNYKLYEKIFHGPKGKAVITDNFGIHRAISPKKPRLVFWLTFSLTQSNGHNNLKISNILPQKREAYSKFKGNIENNLLNRNTYKNLINFEI